MATFAAASPGEVKSASPVYLKLEVEDFEGFGAYKGKEVWTHRMAWWPQWSRGGDSGWWAAQGDAAAVEGEISIPITVPQSDVYTLWARYEDYLGKAEPFDVVVQHPGGEARAAFGRGDVVAAAAPPFPWNYAWDKGTVGLKKGPAMVRVVLAGAGPVRRALDALVLTTDAHWQPQGRAFPPMAYAEYLLQWAQNRQPLPPLVASPKPAVPQGWTLPAVAGQDFWYLGGSLDSRFPRLISVEGMNAPETLPNFIKAYSEKPESAPVFGSPRCAGRLAIGGVGGLLKPDDPMRKYVLEKKVPFVIGGNYASAGKVPDSYNEMKKVFGDLWVGIISGEGSYLGVPLTPENVPLGPDFKESNYRWILGEGRGVWQNRLSEDWATPIADPFAKFILCSSVGTLPHIHRWAESGVQVLGAESAGAMPYIDLQMAFARGAARQYGRRWLWYFGASFGDAIRTFTAEYAYVLSLEGLSVDNRNEKVGPSLAHIRRTLLHAYLQGASFFYPEQGYNLFAADGTLNPMGWSYDEMMRLATRHPDRGVTYTPVAVLLDHAHGWDKYEYTGMHVWGRQALQRSDRMIDGFFNVAYFPFPHNEGDPVDDLNVPWPNGYFGDIFDILVTSPTMTDAVNAYPVVFCVGDTRLDARWVEALKAYVRNGGTLVLNVEQAAAGMDEAFLGVTLSKTWKEDTEVECQPDGQKLSGTVFPYLLVTPKAEANVIAKTPGGDPVAVISKVGKGQVILTTPSYLLGHDGVPMPYMARLLQQVTSGLLPVQVTGNCQYYVNLHPKGYVVVVSNNEGIAKLSHSAAVMDAGKASTVTLRLREKPLTTQDWLGEQPQAWSYPNEWLPQYTQPIQVEWKQDGGATISTVTLTPGEIRVLFIQTR
ncbi:MAG: hypothetical protein HYU36_14435 [Planctomycetes bacterium]|nr:hypothetical protein [Planctomycetota bacterium]